MMGKLNFWLIFIFCGSAMLLTVRGSIPDIQQDWNREPMRWEEFECPLEDDVTVVMDSGWDLDCTHFNSDGAIVIFFETTRYLGTKDEIKRQRACALLPQKATLYFPAYDVDAHYSGNYGCKPEKDV
ncbi:MAG: hypothetical protein WCS73_09355, partial [Lentisphaeria bacterium]